MTAGGDGRPGRVLIGVDPHKRSATIEALDEVERVVATGRYGTDSAGYRDMIAAGRRWPGRLWAVEGGQGVGRQLAQRLVADGEPVVDVPAKLSARARMFSTGHGRKTDVTDAHSVAVVALRTRGLRPVQADDASVALRLMADRRDELGAARTMTVNRLHRLLVELVPGGANRSLSAARAAALLAAVRPGDVVGRTRRRLAIELVDELRGTDKKITAANRELSELLATSDSSLLELTGIGPSGAARLLGDIGDIRRFPTRGHFASWNGTAPIDASSGDQQRHRLSRAGNRRINRVLHTMAVVQLRYDTDSRAYYRHKLANGKTPREAMRSLKRRLSDIVYRRLLADHRRRAGTDEADPGGQAGAAPDSSAVDFHPTVDASDRSRPGPAATEATPHPVTGPDRSSTRSHSPRRAPARRRRPTRSD